MELGLPLAFLLTHENDYLVVGKSSCLYYLGLGFSVLFVLKLSHRRLFFSYFHDFLLSLCPENGSIT